MFQSFEYGGKRTVVCLVVDPLRDLLSDYASLTVQDLDLNG